MLSAALSCWRHLLGRYVDLTSLPWQFPVRNGRHLELEVVLYDADSRPFDNFTSLQWQWESSDPILLPTPAVRSMTHHDKGAVMAVQLASLSGSVAITATSNSHSHQYLRAEKISFEV